MGRWARRCTGCFWAQLMGACLEKIVDETQLENCLAKVDLILDARSPCEFAHDHIPNAVNVPMLTDEQRVEVGTLYVQNAFEAKKLGAGYATLAIHQFLAHPIMAKAGKGTRILVYCARGGQRSAALSIVLSHIGFHVSRLKRGYKTYRAHVLEVLARPLPRPVYVLYGYTGTGKTRILEAVRDDVNVLDLEGLACHRGSLLGAVPGRRQPTQKAFETRLMEEVVRFDAHKPTLLEGESRKVGRLTIPAPLWVQMNQAHHLWLEIPRTSRRDFILSDYTELKDPQLLVQPLGKLAHYLPREVITQLRKWIALREWEPFVETLLTLHYDPLYARPLKRGDREGHCAANVTEGIEVIRTRVLQSLSAS